MLMRTYVFNGVIESMVPNIEKESKSPDGNDMNEEEKKISNILSKLSVEKTKELSSLSSDQITALVKLVAVMEQNQIDAFLEMSMDKIKEMINEAMD
jgi:helix-turn-helix protein